MEARTEIRKIGTSDGVRVTPLPNGGEQSWPLPALDRCPDCQNVGVRPAKGSLEGAIIVCTCRIGKQVRAGFGG